MNKKQNKWKFQELEISLLDKTPFLIAQNRKILKSAFAMQSECTSGNSKQNIKNGSLIWPVESQTASTLIDRN